MNAILIHIIAISKYMQYKCSSKNKYMLFLTIHGKKIKHMQERNETGKMGKRKVRRSEDKRKVGRDTGRMREADVVERCGGGGLTEMEKKETGASPIGTHRTFVILYSLLYSQRNSKFFQ